MNAQANTSMQHSSVSNDLNWPLPMKLAVANAAPRGWLPPGLSPLSRRSHVSSTRDPAHEELMHIDENASSASSSNSLRIRSHSRALGSRRVVPSLRHTLSKARLLRRVSLLSIEDAELDSLDERSIEFLLEAQATAIPSLAPFARVPGDPSRLGTPPRRTKWCAQRRMPWRVMDYGKSAERMLERQRASERLMNLRRV